ncbi:MAG: YVTN family beta-propeller repeat protein [Pseudomonadota bacterium]
MMSTKPEYPTFAPRMSPRWHKIAGGFVIAAFGLLSSYAFAIADTVYVSNEKDNTISIIDAGTKKVIKTIKVGQRPRGIMLAKDGAWLLVCASDDNRVEVYDANTLEFIKTLPSGPDPELFELHPSGNPLYIANEDDNIVTVVDIDKGTILAEVPVGVEPEGMGVSPDGKYVVNTSETTNMAHFIDTTTNETVANILVDNRPRVAQFTPDGKLLWVSAEIGGTVTIIDVATKEPIHKINFAIQGINADAIQPVGVRINKAGTKAYVALGPANRVAIVDAKTYEVEKYILTGQRVWNLAFTPDEKYIYTTNGVSNDVTVIDVAKERAVRSIRVGRYPWGVVTGESTLTN